MANLRRVLSALVGKQKSLAEGRRMRTAASVDFQASDTAKFLRSFTPSTRTSRSSSHIVDHGVAHPEEVLPGDPRPT